jgi:hypothetical protein
MKVLNSKNIDEAKSSPLAQQLFYLPFVRQYTYQETYRYRKYNIVEWDDVKDAAEQINTFVSNGTIITIDEKKQKK